MSEQDHGPPPTPGPTGAPDFGWLFFRFDGRIGREAYWLALALVWVLLLAALGLMGDALGENGAGLPVIVLGIVVLWAEIALVVKRLHDRGLPGYWALIVLVPFANLIWLVVVGIMKGDDGPNAYASGPDRRGDVPPRQSGGGGG